MAAPTDSVDKDALCVIEATVATGFEQTAREEVAEKLHLDVKTARGKLIITTPINVVPKILKLGTIDNCRVVIKQIKGFHFPKDQAESLQKLRELVKEIDWSHGITVWNRVFSFDHPINTSHEDATGYVGVAETKDKETLQKKTTKEKKSKKKGRGRDRKKNEKGKGKSGEGEEDGKTNDVEEEEKENKEKQMEDQAVAADTGVSPTKGLESNPDSSQESPVKDLESPRKQEADPSKPKFRVTCNRTGDHHKFDSTNTASNFGGAIWQYFGWNVDLKNFDIEVILNIDCDDVTVCLGLTKESLHKRLLTSFGMSTLRPTIAYNMLRLCELQCGDVVCDPMCGSGSIPISASVSWPLAIHMCGELHSKALEKTMENLTNLNAKKKSNQRRLLDLDVYQWDATDLPLRDGCVDVFITDLPFGRRHSRGMPNHKLYPLVLNEMARVTRKETGRACFITEDRKCMVKIIQESRVWQRRKVLAVSMGGIDTGVYLLHRTKEDVEERDGQQTIHGNKRPLHTEESNGEPKEEPSTLSNGSSESSTEPSSTKNAESSSQTTEDTFRTTETSSQVSGTNISSADTSSQTLESGSPRKRAKTNISESECQTIGQPDDIPKSPNGGGHFESYAETRSQMTETIGKPTADIGFQIENQISSTSSGMQAGDSPSKVKTRSQANATAEFVSDTRSQSTETRKMMADSGCQATTTRNTSTLTGNLSVRTAATDTDSHKSSTESSTQAAETKVMADASLQASCSHHEQKPTSDEPLVQESKVTEQSEKDEVCPSSNREQVASESQESSKFPSEKPPPIADSPSNTSTIPDSTQMSPVSENKPASTSIHQPMNDKSSPLKNKLKQPQVNSSSPSESAVTSTSGDDDTNLPEQSTPPEMQEGSEVPGKVSGNSSSVPQARSEQVSPKVGEGKPENPEKEAPPEQENKETSRLKTLRSDPKHGSSVDLEPLGSEGDVGTEPSVMGEKNVTACDDNGDKKDNEVNDAKEKEKGKGCTII